MVRSWIFAVPTAVIGGDEETMGVTVAAVVFARRADARRLSSKLVLQFFKLCIFGLQLLREIFDGVRQCLHRFSVGRCCGCEVGECFGGFFITSMSSGGIGAVESGLLGGLLLTTKLLLGGQEMRLEVVPSFLGSWSCVPRFAIIKVHAGVKDKRVCIVEDLGCSVGLIAGFGELLAVFDLVDEHLERRVGIPGRFNFLVIADKIDGRNETVGSKKKL